MKLELNSLPWQSLSAALVAQLVVATPSYAAPQDAPAVAPAGVSCVVPDLRTGEPVVRKPLTQAASVQREASPRASSRVAAPVKVAALQKVERTVAGSWSPEYRGTGVSRMKDGAAKARVARLGVLWTVDPASLGASQDDAVAALLKAGAASARADGEGKVYFRARERDRNRIASRAAAYLGGGEQTGEQMASSPSRGPVSIASILDGAPRPTPAGITANDLNRAVLNRMTGGESLAVAEVADDVQVIEQAPELQKVSVAPASNAMGVEVAMLRIEGTSSLTAESFIDSLPSGMSVYPFGTGYAVHVPGAMSDGMWAAIDGEGKRVLLVGSAAPLQQGVNASDSLRYCGGESVLKRFPTPQVERVSMTEALLGVEDQKLATKAGDIVMVIKAPTAGKGIEVALMRFTAR